MNTLSSVVLLCLISALAAVNGQNPEPTETFPEAPLGLFSSDLSLLYWKHDNTDITFEIHFKNTSKWVAFGIESQSKGYADLVVGWLNEDLTGHFSDRKMLTNNNNDLVTTVDSSQDWVIQDALKSNSNDWTILKFKRKIKLVCDEKAREASDDLDISLGNTQLVFAMGKEKDDKSGDILDMQGLSRLSHNLLRNPFDFACAPEPEPALRLQPTATYSNMAELMSNGDYVLYWNTTEAMLVGEVHVRTTGWIAFGISPTGGMDGSDVFVAWVPSSGSDSQTHFTDRYIKERSVLVDSISQDWKLLNSMEKDGITVIKFERLLLLCDEGEDIKIEVGSPFIIFAYGSQDPSQGEDIGYHLSKRGAKALNIIASASKVTESTVPLETTVFPLGNLIVPYLETFYYIKLFKVPDYLLQQKRHVLKWEILLPKSINHDNIHHLVVSECDLSLTDEIAEAFQPGYAYSEDPDIKVVKQSCGKITITWAYGGNPVYSYPKTTGYPIGGNTDYKFILIEVHYNNPALKVGYIEEVSLKLHMTKEMQENELGGLSVGPWHVPPGSILVPPKQQDFGVTSTCSSRCLKQMLQGQDITVISAMPHTHLAGFEMYTKIVREGKDIGYLYRNANYDFNYQNNYPLNVTIKPQDDLVTFCGYNTMDREKYTVGGDSTQQEMCYQFYMYYPRIKTCTSCLTVPDYESLAQFILEQENLGNIPGGPLTDFTVEGISRRAEEIAYNLSNNATLAAASTKFAKDSAVFAKTMDQGSMCSNTGYQKIKQIQVEKTENQECKAQSEESEEPGTGVEAQENPFAQLFNQIAVFFQTIASFFG